MWTEGGVEAHCAVLGAPALPQELLPLPLFANRASRIAVVERIGHTEDTQGSFANRASRIAVIQRVGHKDDSQSRILLTFDDRVFI